MVLSSRKPRNPPTNMPVVSSTWMTWSSWRIPRAKTKVTGMPKDQRPRWLCLCGRHSIGGGDSPVWTLSGFLFTQLGMASPQ